MQKTINPINIMNSLLINDTIDIDNIDLLIKQIKEEISMKDKNKMGST